MYTDDQLKFIIESRESGLTWKDTASLYSDKFEEKSLDAIRRAYLKYQYHNELKVDEVDIGLLRSLRTTRRANAAMGKQNRIILDQAITFEQVLESLREMKFELPKYPSLKEIKSQSKGKAMTIEAMLSDIHFGKKTKHFNDAICVRRLQQFRDALLMEIDTNSKTFKIDKVIVALLGDIIENATMHGVESMMGCEYSNPQQVQRAIEVLFQEVLVPLAATGLKIEVPCVTGNHDRPDERKTFHDPGLSHLTHIVYRTLELLCKTAKFKNVTFFIAEKSYLLHKIYDNHILYEHFDLVRSTQKKSFEDQIQKRQTQLGTIIDFFHGGHFHEYTCWDRGRIIINGSVPGPDSYSDTLGFDSHASQTINLYVKTASRPNCFYKSFPVYLD